MVETREALLVNKLAGMVPNTTEYRIIRNTLSDEGRVLLRKLRNKQVRERVRQVSLNNLQNETLSDDEEEIWKDIDGYENYMVSSKGRVMNKASGKILKSGVEGSGYEVVNLCNESGMHPQHVHKLVASAFLAKTDEDQQDIDHCDRNKINNKITNLRYLNRSENSRSTSKRSNAVSRYKGVCYDKIRKKWKARIQVERNNIQIGLFDTEVEAAEAYNSKARELSELFILNIIPSDDPHDRVEPPSEATAQAEPLSESVPLIQPNEPIPVS